VHEIERDRDVVAEAVHRNQLDPVIEVSAHVRNRSDGVHDRILVDTVNG
jgi:hypothetical protein